MGPTLARRLSILCDPDSLEKQLESSGSVYFTGWAKIKGRKVMVIAADPDPLPEPANLSLSSSRYVKALQQADADACPVVFLHDSPASYQSGLTAFQGTGVELMMGKNGVEDNTLKLPGFRDKSHWSALFLGIWPRPRPFQRSCATGW